MNEGMIELYKEAAEFAYKICKDEGRTGGPTDHIWNTISTGKLAELIVRECVKKSVEICLDRFQGDCWKNNKEDIEALRCSQDIQRLLPKHFGVDE